MGSSQTAENGVSGLSSEGWVIVKEEPEDIAGRV
jgi:hypothetical protein